MDDDPFSLNRDYNGFTLPEDLFPPPPNKQDEINELKEKVNRLTYCCEQLYQRNNQLIESNNKIVNYVNKLKDEFFSFKDHVESTGKSHKKRKVELDINDLLTKSRNSSDDWKEGMSKYVSITYNNLKNNWKIHSTIFDIYRQNIKTKEIAESIFEGVVTSNGISLDSVLRKGYKN